MSLLIPTGLRFDSATAKTAFFRWLSPRIFGIFRWIFLVVDLFSRVTFYSRFRPFFWAKKIIIFTKMFDFWATKWIQSCLTENFTILVYLSRKGRRHLKNAVKGSLSYSLGPEYVFGFNFTECGTEIKNTSHGIEYANVLQGLPAAKVSAYHWSLAYLSVSVVYG